MRAQPPDISDDCELAGNPPPLRRTTQESHRLHVERHERMEDRVPLFRMTWRCQKSITLVYGRPNAAISNDKGADRPDIE
jgi:hypothetical protein